VDVGTAVLLDAALLTFLVRLGDRLRAGGRDLVVVCREPALRRLLEHTVANASFQVARSCSDADGRRGEPAVRAR
jgi:anti-anti-sigma regulatory factor